VSHVPHLRRFHEKVGGCQAQCTLGTGSSETPPTPSSPAFRSGAEKAPQMDPGAFSAPCKMQAMGPLRALCQTLFVWRCARGPQPATAPSAPMAITSGFVSFRYNLLEHRRHSRNSGSSESIQIQPSSTPPILPCFHPHSCVGRSGPGACWGPSILVLPSRFRFQVALPSAEPQSPELGSRWIVSSLHGYVVPFGSLVIRCLSVHYAFATAANAASWSPALRNGSYASAVTHSL